MCVYKKSAVFTSLGSWEGLPTRLMEAMQFEVPCITFSADGRSELIQDGKNGFIINKLEEKLLAEKLIILLKNKRFAEKLGKNARQTIIDRFNWKNIFKEIWRTCKE